MNRKRITAIVLASCLAVCLASPAFAYDYSVNVSGGNQGKYTGSTPSGVAYDNPWGPDMNDIQLNNGSKYYVKGFHISGQDKELTGAIPITEDTTFVASYGIKGSKTIEYTIHYVDESGNTLAEDATYYGNIGDKPVVGYRDIDGYLPRDTYNVTWTLTGEGDEYSFVYIPSNTTVTTTTTTTNTVTAPGTTTTTTGTAGTGTATGTTAAGGTAAGGAAAGGTAGGAGVADAGAAGPADIVDLDEGDVPLAGVDDANGDNGDGTAAAGDEEVINDEQPPTAGLPTAAKAGIGVVIAAAVVAVIAALAVRARKKKNEEA